MSRTIPIIFGSIWILSSGLFSQAQEIDQELKDEIKSSIDRALRYVRFEQEQNGSWKNSPRLTALAARAFMESPRRYTEEDGPFVRNALEFLAEAAGSNGVIDAEGRPILDTSVALMALKASGNPRYQPRLDGAKEFLVQSILDESVGGKDLSDTTAFAFAMEALHEVGVPARHPVWEKASKQIDELGVGTVTAYAGLRSRFHAGFEENDRICRNAFDSIRTRYLDKVRDPRTPVPYDDYYFVASALSVCGTPPTQEHGEGPDWWRELSRRLLSLQHYDSYWPAGTMDWLEDERIGATTLAILALNKAYSQ